MSDVVIRAENLGKLYRIGQAHRRHDSLLAATMAVVSSPIRNFNRLRRLDTAGALAEGEEEAEGLLWALRDVSFEVRRGEVLGVIGRNGAGKSTLLKIFSRITEPTCGRVRLRGRLASLLEVGTGFNPELTGRENVYLNGTILGMTRREIERKFDEIVDFSGVEKFLDTPVKRYSSGMKVRLGFAVAAHLEPDILIVDEVLAVGDVEFQRKCIGKMHDVVSDGSRTILFVSHNVGSVQALCNRALWLRDGQVVRIGGVDEVTASYMESFASLIQVPIAERTDRNGQGRARITDLYWTSPDGKRNPHLVSGSRCALTIEYRADHRLRSPIFQVMIYDHNGCRLINFNSSRVAEPARELPTEGTARCELDRLPLSPGLYRINVALVDATGLQDHIEMALEFHVEAGDFHGLGRTYELPQGVCLGDCSWSLEPETRPGLAGTDLAAPVDDQRVRL